LPYFSNFGIKRLPSNDECTPSKNRNILSYGEATVENPEFCHFRLLDTTNFVHGLQHKWTVTEAFTHGVKIWCRCPRCDQAFGGCLGMEPQGKDAQFSKIPQTYFVDNIWIHYLKFPKLMKVWLLIFHQWTSSFKHLTMIAFNLTVQCSFFVSCFKSATDIYYQDLILVHASCVVSYWLVKAVWHPLGCVHTS